ncbi:MAG: type II secretion system protein [Kiritimatiellia bacterium]|jgi:prepilin-type N-terminal cleavage/methylation domain-containing protein
MNQRFHRTPPGFTLIELLIVVGILAVLIGLLTPAILKNLNIVAQRRHANERKLLEAAIMEYWHDKGVWPLPKKGETGYKRPDGNSKVAYRFDNYHVFNRVLCNAVLHEPGGKDYFDPDHRLTTLEKCNEKDYPNFLPARVIDAIEGRNDVRARKELTLVYWVRLIECPQCPSSDIRRFHGESAESCKNPECKFRKSKGYGYPFPRGVRRKTTRGLMPYKVTIDLLNNRAIVTDD